MAASIAFGALLTIVTTLLVNALIWFGRLHYQVIKPAISGQLTVPRRIPMTKKLLVVAASGLVLAILLLSAAWVTGGTALMAAPHRGNWSFDDDDDHRPTATRSYTFDSAAPFTVNAPVELHFVRGDQATMTISGSPAMLAAVHWDHNRLSLNEGLFGDHHSLKVDIVAPQLPPLTLCRRRRRLAGQSRPARSPARSQRRGQFRSQRQEPRRSR